MASVTAQRSFVALVNLTSVDDVFQIWGTGTSTGFIRTATTISAMICGRVQSSPAFAARRLDATTSKSPLCEHQSISLQTHRHQARLAARVPEHSLTTLWDIDLQRPLKAFVAFTSVTVTLSTRLPFPHASRSSLPTLTLPANVSTLLVDWDQHFAILIIKSLAVMFDLFASSSSRSFSASCTIRSNSD